MAVVFSAAITKGRKFRTIWISYDALAGLHDYLQLDRAAVTDGSAWRPPRRWGEPLQVTQRTHVAAGLTAFAGRGSR